MSMPDKLTADEREDFERLLRSLGEGEACPKCGSTMTHGRALVGAPRGCTYEGEWPVKLVDCTKCHTCGYSETAPGAETHFVVPKAN